MATRIKGGEAPRKRGRPSKAELEARRDAAARAEGIVAGTIKVDEKPAATPPADDKAAKRAAAQAPGFGHNAPDEGVFLRHVHAIQQFKEGPLAAAKAKLKEENGKLKDLRQLAKADGLVLKELDEAVEDARTERVDLVAKEQRRRLYREWLGLPFEQSDLFEEHEGTPSLAREQLRWKAIGNTDGRLGRTRAAPDDCPSNMESHYLAGWDEGQAALMKALPVTAGAFNADGSVKTTADPAPVGQPTDAPASPAADNVVGIQAVVILGERDFDGIEGNLEEANRRTLANDTLRERFDAAERVVAVFGAKRRILKEPGYVDDGLAETPLSDEEDAAEEEVAAVTGEGSALDAIAEAEPELVEQVLEDHGADDDAEIPGEKPLEPETDSFE